MRGFAICVPSGMVRRKFLQTRTIFFRRFTRDTNRKKNPSNRLFLFSEKKKGPRVRYAKTSWNHFLTTMIFGVRPEVVSPTGLLTGVSHRRSIIWLSLFNCRMAAELLLQRDFFIAISKWGKVFFNFFAVRRCPFRHLSPRSFQTTSPFLP